MQNYSAIVAICLAITTVSATAQSPDHLPGDSPRTIAWDVISVKPNHSVDSSAGMYWSIDGIQLRNMTLHGLFLNAFDVRSESQITGYPAWVNSDHFDIQAKMDAETANAYHKLTDTNRSQQWHSLVLQILEDRFGMKYHVEQRELPVYNLVVAKQGVKFKESAQEEPALSSMRPGKLSAHRSQVGNLAFRLSGTVGRVIIDKTGLTGLYDIDLTWSPDNEQPDAGPSIFTALQEQLGLKLESAKAHVDVIIIDHLERPSEN